MNDSTIVLESGKNNMPGSPSKYAEIYFYSIGILILLSLYILSTFHFLLFHSIAEGFSIVIACGIFMVVWNSRQFIDNDYFLLIGIACLFVAFIDLLHMLAYRGLGVFPEGGANLPTQLWIASRYMQAATLLIAPLIVSKKINLNITYIIYFAVTVLIITSIFYWKTFPVCYVEGSGLTGFKINSEYIISGMLILSAYLLSLKRKEFNKNIFALVVASIILTVISEIFFTLYFSSYDKLNVYGHLFKIISFYLLYKAIIQTGLRNPYDLLFHHLKQKEEALQLTRFSIDRADDLIIWIRSDCNISDINNTTVEKLGFSHHELLAMSIFNIDKNLSSSDFKKIWTLIKNKGTYTAEHLFKKRTALFLKLKQSSITSISVKMNIVVLFFVILQKGKKLRAQYTRANKDLGH